MTKEELREKLASALLDALMYQTQKDPTLPQKIDDLLFRGPSDTIRVTISVEGVDRSTLSAVDRDMIAQSKDHETMTVLCANLRIDGASHFPNHTGSNYLLITPCSETPDCEPPSERAAMRQKSGL